MVQIKFNSIYSLIGQQRKSSEQFPQDINTKPYARFINDRLENNILEKRITAGKYF